MDQCNNKKPESTQLAMEGGIEIELLNYGARLKSIRVPVKNDMLEVLLGYPDDQDYLRDEAYLGATLGRYAGRIDSGRTTLYGKNIQLQQNDTPTGHCLHGGAVGFSHHFWLCSEQTQNSVTYEYTSPDGDQGFPGCLRTQVTYTLSSPTTLQIDYTATADTETIINLSNHAYFNLNTHNESIANHQLMLNSDFYAPLAENSLPCGQIQCVEDTVFDFRQATGLDKRLYTPDPQLLMAGGYDHYFLLNSIPQTTAFAATLHSPESGLTMKMFTDQPGVQFYSGNWLAAPFTPQTGLCLEFQDIPNEPNLSGFPSTTLQPGETYRRRIVLEFEI